MKTLIPLSNLSISKMGWLALIGLAFLSAACDFTPDKPLETPLVIAQPDSIAEPLAQEARTSVAARVIDGMQLSLWASDSLAPDPVAMDIDRWGRIYLTRTNRQKNSEFDIRGHRDWMTASIGLQSVEDRRAFLQETFAPEKSAENEWLKDLNQDTIHDWRDLRVEEDEVWRLEDRSGNGTADVATRILSDFHEEVSDVAGALLVQDDAIYVGIAPDMWRLTDTNGDEVLDTKESLATGFMVHIGFGGHGMSGAIMGPDGKLYWGIGDIGASITARDGSKHHYPNQGVIVRCNPDGSHFEVFARGLRNTHEFVFDAYGNLITSDNDGDHQGESERLVYLVEGSDSGWRTNWQFGKYTDPKNNSYKVWMDEKLYLPRWEGQAAYIIPPIQNYHNGPTGMVYNPGTALGSRWQDKFFLVEFIGDPARSHIWAFDLQPQGAGFALKSEADVLSGVLPTGIRFGPDGALYLADWINGWNTKNAGRVWKLDVTPEEDDLAVQRTETRRLIQLDYGDQDRETLAGLLEYADMRVRQMAQFELAGRGRRGYQTFKEVLENSAHPLAKIHAIWGIGQLAESKPELAEILLPLLSSDDPELTAQAAKVLGNVRYAEAGAALLPLLENQPPRVQFFAAQSLGRLAYAPAVEALIELLAANDDQDVYLRHAAVLALSRIGEVDPILALATSPNPSLRLAGVLVLRRLQHPGITRFLSDSDPYILAEAARAINDDWSIPEALPALAALLDREGLDSEPLMRRAINAALRTGTEEDLDRLLAYAQREDVPAVLRGEALAALGSWANPSVLDRVTGRYRGPAERDAALVTGKVSDQIPSLLASTDPAILAGTGQVIRELGITGHNARLRELFDRHSDGATRAALLQTLRSLPDERIGDYLRKGLADPYNGVRTTAISLLPVLDLPADALPGIVTPIFKEGSVGEQQAMLATLAEMPLEKSEPVLGSLLEDATKDRIAPGAILDLIEAVEATGSPALMAGLETLKNSGYSVDSFQETLYGGSWWAGQSVFTSNPAAQCVRCHAVNGAGGQVGPALDSIASVLSREEILESLINPNARIAPGYGSVSLTLTDGQQISGLLLEEDPQTLVLQGEEAEPLRIPVSRVAKRTNQPSAMPPMGRVISRRELRDLMEYLGSLKGNP
ncbi:HEAT repeat domain-containing protein [Robiginitalea sp. M366]|uniref:HEAT repeat domain-containing protein n=1 Tax=Robiginitalea aestuariiviva TaxID=3036903 RepID=UPI00240E54F4|nr:HEAT repeat domain-containing protein [Robiginitalea aestuariiviva]MDG1572563.1 HEAT repeat domain-containing protein [Robiginitalea aestuariiviva]